MAFITDSDKHPQSGIAMFQEKRLPITGEYYFLMLLRKSDHREIKTKS